MSGFGFRVVPLSRIHSCNLEFFKEQTPDKLILKPVVDLLKLVARLTVIRRQMLCNRLPLTESFPSVLVDMGELSKVLF